MSPERNELTNPHRRLPDLSLPSLNTGAPTPLRPPGRKAPVLVLLHGHGCRECRAYLQELADHHGPLAEWDGQVLIIRSDEPGSHVAAARESDLPFPLLADPDQRLASALSIQTPATVIADQWGEIHALDEAGPEHRFSSPEELIGWVRYLAVRCPECEGEAF